MLTFTKLTPAEKANALRNVRKQSGAYVALLDEFVASDEEIAKLSGFTSTEASKIYYSISSTANSYFKEQGVKVSKRGDNIYLLNTKKNPVVEAPEKR